MSDADDAYKEAQRLIAAALRSGVEILNLDTEETHALTTLPPEIADLTGVIGFVLSNTQITDLAPLAGLTGIKGLFLDDTQITDLSPLSELTGINSLYLDNTQITDFSPLAGLTGITILYLNNAQITDLTLLSGLTGLESLGLGNTQITDFGPLARMTELATLFLDNTQITDLSPLSGLTGITDLALSDTQITDLAPLAGLTGITRLFLYNTQVADMRPLLPLAELAKEPSLGGLGFLNTPATRLDPKLAELSKIEGDQERATKTFAYLREVGDDWPPLPANVTPIAPQSGKGFQYAPTGGGPIGYNNPATTIEPTSQLAQLHTLLKGELKAFLQSSPEGGEFHQRLVSKVAAYQTNLGGSVSDLVPIMVWKSGNDLRIELREAKEQPAPTINTPPLDVGRRTDLDSIVTLHNAFASLHPEIAELDVVGLDPADRHVSELTNEILSDALTAINAQVVLLMDDVRRDLQDLHTEAMTDGKAALRALNLEDESLQNLIKAIVAEAVIETKGGGVLSRTKGYVEGAVVGAALTAAGPEVAATYTQLVAALEPYMGQLVTAWHGPDSNIKSTIDWVMLRLRMNPNQDERSKDSE